MLSASTIWQILKTRMPKGRWAPIGEIYQIVKGNAALGDVGVKPAAYSLDQLPWKRNVKHVLQNREKTGDIQRNPEQASYRLAPDVKVKDSWSKLEGQTGLIGRKKVDWSLFDDGTTIPTEFHEEFQRGNQGYALRPGERHAVTLVIESAEYEADLRLLDTGRMQLRYNANQSLRQLLRERFATSYEYLRSERTSHYSASEQKAYITVPDPQAEYMDFYDTGTPFRYRIELVSLVDLDQVQVPDFDEVWLDLMEIIGDGITVHTLSRQAPNRVQWVERTGIQVETGQGQEILPRSMFEAAWDSVVKHHIVVADDLPREASYRSTAIMSLLALLPYVDYTTYPKATLFLTSHHFTRDELGRTFKVGPYRGIMPAGNAEDRKLVVFSTDAPGAKDAGNPYSDRWDGDMLYYCGEGQEGDQKLSGGNLALKQNIDLGFPVYGFTKLRPDVYRYMGRFKVLEVQQEQQPDRQGNMRTVFVFRMRRVSGHINHTVPNPPRAPRMVKVAPGEGSRLWPECRDGSYICVGWDEVGDLTQYRTKEDFDEAFRREFKELHKGHGPTLSREGNELWTLRELEPGDKVVANRGTSEVFAVGEVISPGYQWRPDRAEYRHTARVRWDTTYAKRIPKQDVWATTTVATVPPELYELITDPTKQLPPARLDLAAVQAEFSAALKASHIAFPDDLVRAFVAALATKRFAILTGLSGSGKTQIALRFGEWLGNRKQVIAVRPDWTGAEALFGYQNALSQDGTWFVPDALAFMLLAAADPDQPYLLVLDEMNLAHVERYFADVLSGMESGEPCLPNLDPATGRPRPDDDAQLRFPPNLFIVGTVNVDETTYMFSPKVLDRANTFEFRVDPDDLSPAPKKPTECAPGDPTLARGYLEIAKDDQYHLEHPAPKGEEFIMYLRMLHRLLREDNFEFGHRVFYEAVRFSAMLAAAGDADPEHALDLQIMQKVLPRLHGTRRRLEDTLCALGRFCFDLTYDPDKGIPRGSDRFEVEKADPNVARLPLSFNKVRRMLRSLRANQFTSFTE